MDRPSRSTLQGSLPDQQCPDVARPAVRRDVEQRQRHVCDFPGDLRAGDSQREHEPVGGHQSQVSGRIRERRRRLPSPMSWSSRPITRLGSARPTGTRSAHGPQSAPSERLRSAFLNTQTGEVFDPLTEGFSRRQAEGRPVHPGPGLADGRSATTASTTTSRPAPTAVVEFDMTGIGDGLGAAARRQMAQHGRRRRSSATSTRSATRTGR